MKILAFETSCDETACSVVADGQKVLGYSVLSSLALHAETGGVVPEVAAREHVLAIGQVQDEALRQAGLNLDEVDAIACTCGPGLVTSLLTGYLHSRTLAMALAKPFIPVHHILAHIYANFLERDKSEIEFPFVCLTVSGGHNELLLFRDYFDFEVLGRTRDDAAGEAFDKVARLLGLGYPGGPAISQMAERGEAGRFVFPRAWLNEGAGNPKVWDQKNYDFSFSGLKSAVRRVVEETGTLTEQDKADLALAFQEAVNDVLSTKAKTALAKTHSKKLLLSGGVSANRDLRTKCGEVLFPKQIKYCTDNAAMVGAVAYFQILENVLPKIEEASASLDLDLFLK